MATEPIQAGPYPAPTDAPDGPNQMSAIVTWAAGRTVMRFASTTARDAAIPTPTEGMEAFTGTGGTAVKWLYFDAAWRDVTIVAPTDWTPTLLGSVTNPNLGSTGSIVGRWWRNGKVAGGYVYLTFGGTGVSAGSGTWTIMLPFTLAANPAVVGTAWIYDASAATGHIGATYASGSVLGVRPSGTGSVVTHAFPIAWATGDSMRLDFSCEIA